MLANVAIYLVIGVIWQLWLEKFTMKNLSGVYAQPMTNHEIITHVIFWPITLGMFLIKFFITLFGGDK